MPVKLTHTTDNDSRRGKDGGSRLLIIVVGALHPRLHMPCTFMPYTLYTSMPSHVLRLVRWVWNEQVKKAKQSKLE